LYQFILILQFLQFQYIATIVTVTATIVVHHLLVNIIGSGNMLELVLTIINEYECPTIIQ